MNKSIFINAIVNGVETRFSDDLKVLFIQGACDYIQSRGDDMWAENIADQVLQVFVRNVHQINVVFDGSKLRILRTDDTIDLELSSFDHEFKDFGLACLAVANFYDASMRHVSESLTENKEVNKSFIDKNEKFDTWPE